VTAWSLVRIDAHREEHRTEVTEGEFKVGRRKALWWTGWFLGEEDPHSGEHRTEVVEALPRAWPRTYRNLDDDNKIKQAKRGALLSNSRPLNLLRW
jgi:hypothetical protein